MQNFKEAVQLLRKCYTFVPDLEGLGERLETCRIECKDIEDELETLASRITVSPQRLEQVEERLSLLYSLMRKHSAGSVEELLQIRDPLEQEVLGADRSIASRDELVAAIGKLKLERDSLAQELSDARKAKVGVLCVTLMNSIRDLQMTYEVFVVAFEDSGKYTLQGKDSVSFLFSANGNGKLNPVQKAASGGELSRIMLCLKALMARFTGMPTMIFDEIDTGVSGSVANAVGEVIAELSASMQVIDITHLPQVASKGNRHYLVYKSESTTNMRQLTDEERVAEIANMLSGENVTEAAIAQAKILLGR